jgi:hypothetical protein
MTRLVFWIGGLTVLAAIGGFNYQLAQTPPDTTPVMTGSNLEPAVVPEGEEVRIEPRNFAITQTRNRPLFAATRRVFVPPPAAVQPKPPPAKKVAAPKEAVLPSPPPQVRLHGIEVSPVGRRALVSFGNSNVAEWLPEGADISGWAISSITVAGIELSSGERRQTIDLYPASQ